MARSVALFARDAVAVMVLGAVAWLAVPPTEPRAGFEDGAYPLL